MKFSRICVSFFLFLLILVYKEQDVSLPFLNYNLSYGHLMKKFRKNTFRVVATLVMLSTASLGVSYSYAESEENLEFEEIQYDLKLPGNSSSSEIRTILTEKMVDGKLEVLELVLPKDTKDEDLKRILSLEDTSGWSYFNYKAYQSGIVLFDGKVSKQGEKYWKISVNGTLDLSKGKLDLKVSGKSNSSDTKIGENPTNENLDYRIIFSGKMTESDRDDVFEYVFMNSSQNLEMNQNFKLLQFGNQTSESVKYPDNNQKVRNSGLVI